MKTRNLKLKGFTYIATVLFMSKFLNADEFHYRNFFPGDRAAGLGGAYTAVADDPSGAYYNPAGLALTVGSELSVSVNAYHVSRTVYQDVLPKVTGGADDWTLRSSKLIPNFFGITRKFGPGTAAFSYAVVDAINRKEEQILYNISSRVAGRYITKYVINIDDDDTVYNAGVSYGLPLSEKISAGATLYLHYRTGKIIRNHLVTLSDNQFEWSNGYFTFSEYGLKPVFGILLSPVNKVSLGFTASKVHIFHSTMRVQQTYRGISEDGYGINDVRFGISENGKKRELPYEFKAGIAYFPSPKLLLSADTVYYTKTDNYKDVWNFSAGFEYYIKDNFALRGGLFTDMANTPQIKRGYINQRDNIDKYGTSLALAYFTRNTSFSAGFVYSYGTGDAQIVGGSPAVQKVRTDSFTFFIGSSYSY